ncbi:MAG: peptidoglycan DD-metalloendopeptidase family protein [Solirubrobacterales bacterium]
MSTGTRSTRSRSVSVLAGTATAIVSVGAGLATAQTPGGGGLEAPSQPIVKDVRCLSGCLDLRSVAVGGTAELVGKELEAVSRIKFNGGAATRPTKVSSKRVTFKVPSGAQSGKPVAIDETGNKGRSARVLDVRPASEVETVEDFSVRSAEASPSKSFFKSKKESQLDYLFESDRPTDLRIDVLKGKRGRVIDSIIEKKQKPFTSQSTTWDGLTEDGAVAPNGKYRFEIQPLSGGEASDVNFKYYDHFFPLRGKHSYGDGLGAGRGHQGQDIFAPCGTKIKAARGGRVQVSAYHSAAGYYVVIDGAKTGQDYVYMHMRRGTLPREGARVKTGDVIGRNSDTGRATGCHLHFELWSGPGWYEGGKVLDPTPVLKRWDRWS